MSKQQSAANAQRVAMAILRQRNLEQQAIITAHAEKLKANIGLAGGTVTATGSDEDGVQEWDEWGDGF